MRLVYFLAFVLILFACGGVYLAAQQLDEASRNLATCEQLRGEISAVEAEIATIKAVDNPTPVKFADDAIAEFYTRLIEAGEVLGAGVRVESKAEVGSTGLPNFVELKHGLKVATVLVQAAADDSAAPALFSMLEEEVDAFPVSVRKLSARPGGGVISLTLEVEVFGR